MEFFRDRGSHLGLAWMQIVFPDIKKCIFLIPRLKIKLSFFRKPVFYGVPEILYSAQVYSFSGRYEPYSHTFLSIPLLSQNGNKFLFQLNQQLAVSLSLKWSVGKRRNFEKFLLSIGDFFELDHFSTRAVCNVGQQKCSS